MKNYKMIILVSITSILLLFVTYLNVSKVNNDTDDSSYFKSATITEISKTNKRTIVYFSQRTCPFCKKIDPILESVIQERDLTIYRIYTEDMKSEEYYPADKLYNLFKNGVPYIIIIDKGNIVDSFNGLQTKEYIEEFFIKNNY